jgi:hypothetical protein
MYQHAFIDVASHRWHPWKSRPKRLNKQELQKTFWRNSCSWRQICVFAHMFAHVFAGTFLFALDHNHDARAWQYYISMW